MITICTSDEGCRCGSWDHDEDSLTYSDCEQMASLQGYTHFSHKDDKCHMGSEDQCLPTGSNYGWATYEIQMSDCTTNSPTGNPPFIQQ